MDLSYGPDYEAFRDAVRAFCREHVGRAQDGRTRDPRAWQRLLIEHGYAARTIPKQYGGFGGTPDILKSRIIAEEFIAAGLPMGMTNQGISMLVPTLLELDPTWVTDINTNIKNMEARTAEGGPAHIDMTVEISDLKHLEKVIKSLRGVDGVLDVERAGTGRAG